MQKLERRVHRLLGGTMYTIHDPFHYIEKANQEGCDLESYHPRKERECSRLHRKVQQKKLYISEERTRKRS